MTSISTAPTAVPPLHAALAGAITDRTATVAVVGLSPVGLQLLVTAGTAGFRLIGVDTDPCLLVAADVIVVTVPTLLSDGPPDLSLVRANMEDVARALRPGQLVVLETTAHPGTTEELARPILEKTGLVAGRDFFLAYSPERVNPADGRPLREFPKIVAGLTPVCTDLAARFYGVLGNGVMRMSSPRHAEMAKLIQNAVRHPDIAIDKGRPLQGSRLVIIGLGSTAGMDDVRKSAELGVLQGLTSAGAECIYHDPSSLSERNLAGADGVVILTAHPGIDYGAVVRLAPLVFDARGVTAKCPADHVVLI
jgi:UDP-N-acetyl-D-mannosaminuronate dehydrogenase